MTTPCTNECSGSLLRSSASEPMAGHHPFTVPPPLSRISVELYAQVRAHILERDPDAREIVSWTQAGRSAPATPEALASEIVWIILCAGRTAQSARTLEAKVWAAIRAGKSAYAGFAYRKKAEAIDRAWRERDADFQAMQQVLATGDALQAARWALSIPYVGEVTRFQLLKNFGLDFPKPDLWLCRLAGIPDRPGGHAEVRFEACMALCRALGPSCGDKLAVSDSLLWAACNKGYLVVGPDAGPVSFNPDPAPRRSFYEAAPQKGESRPRSAPAPVNLDGPDG